MRSEVGGLVSVPERGWTYSSRGSWTVDETLTVTGDSYPDKTSTI